VSIQRRIGSLLKLDVSYRRGLLLSFLVGFAVRLIPELLAYPYPIGYDTVQHAAKVHSGLVWYHWTSVFSTWLLYAFLAPVYASLHVDLFLLLKLAGPVLHAFSACGIYYFAMKALNWNAQKSLIAGFFFVFQLAAFRISWDLLKNTLGMAILLFALPFVMKMESKTDFLWFVFLSTSVVFAHELASVVMFVAVVGIFLRASLRWKLRRLWKISVAVLPALAVFLASMYFWVFPPKLELRTNEISAFQSFSRPAGVFFLADYFAGSGSGQYTGYLDLASHVLSVFVILYLFCLPLVFVGLFRNAILDVWTVFLVLASFGCLVLPFLAFDYWDRWMFLLVYPFTFYAVNGISRVLQSAGGVARPSFGWLKWMKISKAKTIGICSCMILLTSFYVGTTLQSDNYVVFSIPTISRYFSVAPTVPIRDVADTAKVLMWLNENMKDGSCVLVHYALLWWAQLYLERNNVIVSYTTEVERALNVATSFGFAPVYLVWWGESIGWYWFTVPTNFSPTFESGRMSVFTYLTSV